MTADLLPILRSQRLSAIPGVVHGITRRVPGMSPTGGQVGYSPPRDQDDAWRNRECWAAVIATSATASQRLTSGSTNTATTHSA